MVDMTIVGLKSVLLNSVGVGGIFLLNYGQ